MIMKDTSGKDEQEAVFEIVDDDGELNAVAGVFESLLDDVSIVADDSSDKNE